jgi:glutamate-1-semialdehyde 2,1-aminomutase
MRATLTQVLTQENFDRMIDLGTRWSDGVDAAITEFDLPWTCNRLGARGEYMFGKVRTSNWCRCQQRWGL